MVFGDAAEAGAAVIRHAASASTARGMNFIGLLEEGKGAGVRADPNRYEPARSAEVAVAYERSACAWRSRNALAFARLPQVRMLHQTPEAFFVLS
jgi:hypothetical protein